MRKPNLKDMHIFTRQLHAMLKAYVPASQAMRLIADSTTNIALKATLYEIVLSLESGYSLAKSFQKHPAIFPSLLISMTEIGEQTGNMVDAFEHIVQYYEFEIQTRNRIKQTSRYPFLLLIVIVIAVGIINVLIVPQFRTFFSQFGADLPWATQILIALSDFVIHDWYLLIVVMVMCIAGFRFWRQQTVGRQQGDRLVLKVPFLGSIIERSHLARMCRSLALALHSGIPLNEGLTLVERATNNIFLAEKFKSVRYFLERGETFSQSMANSHLFSSLVLQMIIVGEETADLSGMLFQVADFYEEVLDYDVKKLGDTLEPILVGIVAIFVLILALGVFLPMWDISNVAFDKMHGK
jgi:MSHA biogenesis protein MshG